MNQILAQLIAYLHNPAVVIGLYAAFNLLVDSMPEPKPDGGNGYLWLYRVMHSAAMNIKTARGLKMMAPNGAQALAQAVEQKMRDPSQHGSAYQRAANTGRASANSGSDWKDLSK